MKKDRDRVIYQKPVRSDPESTFSIVINRSSTVSFDYCRLCINALGGENRRECGPVTTVYAKSQAQRDEIKTIFKSFLHDAQKRLGDLNTKTPQEFYMLQLQPTILEVDSTDSNHFVVIQFEIKDDIDLISVKDVMRPWINSERIRDHNGITFKGNGIADVRVVFYRIRTQKKFIHYLNKLGLREAI